MSFNKSNIYYHQFVQRKEHVDVDTCRLGSRNRKKKKLRIYVRNGSVKENIDQNIHTQSTTNQKGYNILSTVSRSYDNCRSIQRYGHIFSHKFILISIIRLLLLLLFFYVCTNFFSWFLFFHSSLPSLALYAIYDEDIMKMKKKKHGEGAV